MVLAVGNKLHTTYLKNEKVFVRTNLFKVRKTKS